MDETENLAREIFAVAQIRGGEGHQDVVERISEALRERERVEIIKANALKDCIGMLKFAKHELDLLYSFAISNGIVEAGTPPQVAIGDFLEIIGRLKLPK